jgi:hypothetical protein
MACATLRRVKRLLSATLLVIALLSLAAGAADARPARANALTTRAYLKARLVEMRGDGPAYRAGIRAIEALAGKVQAECRGILPAVPNPSSPSEKEALAEVFAVVVRAPERAEHAVAVSFARAVRHLHWSNRRLTSLVHAEAQRRALQSGIAPPNLCADLKAWAASGYTATSAATKGYLRRLAAAGATPLQASAQKTIKRLLARYEDRSARAIVRRTKKLEAAQARFAAKAFPEATNKVSQALHAGS